MSHRTIYEDIRSVISLLESASGPMRFVKRDGPTTAPSGPDHALASLSAAQVSEKGLLTSGTFGHTGSTSSRSAALATSLENRLRAKDGRAWFDTVQADMEALGFAVGAADLCAAGVGAPHIRQRLWFYGTVADADGVRRAWIGREGQERNCRT